MGRTVWYSKAGNKKIPKSKFNEIGKISDRYNRHPWRCESFYISEEDIGGKDLSFGGFTKTAESDYDTLMVLNAMTEISNVVPTHTFRVHDEGDAIVLPLELRAGLARIHIDRINNDNAYWFKKLGEGNLNFRGYIDTQESRVKAFTTMVTDTSGKLVLRGPQNRYRDPKEFFNVDAYVNINDNGDPGGKIYSHNAKTYNDNVMGIPKDGLPLYVTSKYAFVSFSARERLANRPGDYLSFIEHAYNVDKIKGSV